MRRYILAGFAASLITVVTDLVYRHETGEMAQIWLLTLVFAFWFGAAWLADSYRGRA